MMIVIAMRSTNLQSIRLPTSVRQFFRSRSTVDNFRTLVLPMQVKLSDMRSEKKGVFVFPEYSRMCPFRTSPLNKNRYGREGGDRVTKRKNAKQKSEAGCCESLYASSGCCESLYASFSRCASLFLFRRQLSSFCVLCTLKTAVGRRFTKGYVLYWQAQDVHRPQVEAAQGPCASPTSSHIQNITIVI